MIRVDEEDPTEEVSLSFPYRDVKITRGVDPKSLYTLEEELGRGKFGTVYRCLEKSTNIALAAKFVSVPKKEDRRNVEREIDIMKQLQHPRLLQLYDAFENGKVMCLILELIEGGELFERVIDDDFVLTEKSCTVFMRQICDGVDFIHKQRILHLDMKPENILCLTKTGNRIKIIDFGLARRFDPDKKLQVLFGTPEFVAPEVVNFDQIGFGTDMWSVGVICYVLLSGLSPFMGHTDIETMANVTVAKYDFDDEAFQDISENAKDFIKKLLVKDMKSRMTAEDCLRHSWLERKPIKPQPEILDASKDNLRQFVERWTEHPDSPYIFEITSHSIIHQPHQYNHQKERCNSFHSLLADSPSPCGSICSEGEPPEDITSFLDVPASTLDGMRRASDSSCVIKKMDVSERVNLAEEIKKLSDKLFQLSNINTTLNLDLSESSSNLTQNLRLINTNLQSSYNDQQESEKTSPKIGLEMTKNPANQNASPFLEDTKKIPPHGFVTKNDKNPIQNGTSFVDNLDTNLVKTLRITPPKIYAPPSKEDQSNKAPPLINQHQSLTQTQTQTVPWRKGTKKKVANSSRDVPLMLLNHPHPSKGGVINHSRERSASGTKDMLLRLLDKWESPPNSPHLFKQNGEYEEHQRNSTPPFLRNLGGGASGPSRGRLPSISSEFSENDLLAQKSMSSINSFFQSRINQKITKQKNFNHP